MIIQSVRADTGGREGKWVALIIASILGFATLLIPYHQAEIHVTTAFEHQILVTDVEQENLAMLADLRLAHEEIRDLYFDNDEQWPNIEFLQEEWVAPFIHDQSWKRKGEHNWIRLGSGYYFASPQLTGFADSFLMNANSIAPEIWINLQGQVKAPMKFDIETLSNAGWKQVVTESEAIENQHHEDDEH
ncbi:DUF6162 family protein [Vibrio pelagius]|uniref:DUF6162 family protein n=1 Tax=Vibrio pelagius TaxID=28169 RepID=UPI0021C41FD7|nr:hypothetical protein [Vibrio pelagius]